MWTPNEQLTGHFRMGEFSVSGNHPHLVVPIPDALQPNVRRLAVTILEPCRVHVGTPIAVSSCYRSRALNDAIGGSPTSQHLSAQAADIEVVVNGARSGKQTTALFLDILADRVPRLTKHMVGQVILYPSGGKSGSGIVFIHIALPSRKYPERSAHVHDPARGLVYKIVRSEVEARHHLGLAP